MSAERRRLPLALLLSLLIHALLLSLTFNGAELALPGFSFPWRERRTEVPDLQVLLMPARASAAESAGLLVKAPLQQAWITKTVAGEPAPVRSASASAVPSAGQTAVAITPAITATPPPAPAPAPDHATAAVPAAVPTIAPSRTETSVDAAPAPIPAAMPAPAVIAVERSADPTFVVPPPPPTPAPVVAVAPGAPITPDPATVMSASRDAAEGAQKRAEPEVRERAVEIAKPDPAEREAETLRQRQADQLEAARVETARVEATRLAAARHEATQLEAQRNEAARLEAARLAAAKSEAQRQEIARQEAARAAVARQEAARSEAQRLESARVAAAQADAQRQEAARVDGAQREAARQEAARQEAVRQTAAQKEAARILDEKDEDAKRDARRQAMGRTLNEEAAQRKAAETGARAPASQSTLPYSLSTARRGRLWGRSDPNVELVEYAEAWARRIQFNTSVDTVREIAKRPHTDPMVTVAIRSDGSVESVTFVLSSGVAEVDEAIRRIVQSLVPYPAFPLSLTREYDVIEVRRTWHFDTAVRLY